MELDCIISKQQPKLQKFEEYMHCCLGWFGTRGFWYCQLQYKIMLIDDNLVVHPGKPGHMEVQWILWFQTHTNDYVPHETPKHHAH